MGALYHLKQRLVDFCNVVQQNVNRTDTVPSSAVVYSELKTLNDSLKNSYFASRYSITVEQSATAGTLLFNQKVQFPTGFFSGQPVISISIGTGSPSAVSQNIGVSWDSLTAQEVNLRARALANVSVGTYFIDLVAFRRHS